MCAGLPSICRQIKVHVEKNKTLYITNRDDWRVWLKKNHGSQKEVWLVYYKKHTGKPRIPYDDAVEEAICFGWIDSTVKRLDEEKYAQKFTPRNQRSKWSELNKRRAERMVKQGKMIPAGLAKFKQAGKQKDRKIKEKSGNQRAVVPPDLRRALATDKEALENFNNLAPGYRRLYVAWITDAKRKETREKRIRLTVERSAENKKPGIM